jgi:hypothetical protein
VGPQNSNPFDELAALGKQIDLARSLDELKPAYARLDHLGRTHTDDLEFQLQVDELKQRSVEKGKFLRQSQTAVPIVGAGPASPSASQPVPPQAPIAQPPPAMPQAPPPAQTRREKSPIVQAPPSAAAPRPSVKHWAPRTGKRPLATGIAAGAVVAIVLIGFLAYQARKRYLAQAEVEVRMATLPAGASIRVNGEPKCDSDCNMGLPPGEYQITAFLDGYEPAAANITVNPGKPAAVSINLTPARQSVRILTDLPQGRVTLDDQPPVELQDGQAVFDGLEPGTHSISVVSGAAQASLTVTVEEAKPPVISGPMVAKNMVAVAVATVGNKARLFTSSGPLKLALNGQPQADATPEGVDLTGYQPGVAELSVGEGNEQKTMKESFGPSPALTVFLKSDLNIGTLIVATGEDDVRVFLNNKEYQRRTQKGQIRIPAIGNVTVRVAKDGFEPVAPQTAEITKGGETRIEFKMQASPRFAALLIRGATPGAEVFLDQKSVGIVADDGSLTDNAVPPGDHNIELRRDQYQPKRFQRSFRAGQVVALTGGDVILASALGIVRIARTPAEAAVSYRRADETQGQELRGNQVELPPGTYIFTARAPGYTEKSERIQVTAGEAHPLEIALARVVAAAAPPPPKTGGMADFENPSSWTQQGDLWTHKGGGFVFYKPAPKGTFTFSVQLLRGGNLFRGGKIRWVFQYLDAKNYDLFELDRKSLSSKVIINGKTFDRGKFDHNLSERDMIYTIQIDSQREHLVTKFRIGTDWKTIDSWDEQDRDFTVGKFGFLIQGADEIGLTNFTFVPR